MSSYYTWYPEVIWKIEIEGETPEFDSEEVVEGCSELYNAMKGWGEDRSEMIDALVGKSAEERYKIANKYESLYGEVLRERILSEAGDDFGRIMGLLSVGSDEAEAIMLYDAMKGVGATGKHVYPILCGRSNVDMTVLKKAYFKFKGKDLVETITDNFSGDLKLLFVTCAQGIEENYEPEDVHTEERVEEDVEVFYNAGEGRWGTDERNFFRILCQSPPEHLKAINEAYTNKYDVTMKKAVTKELSGTAEDAALYLLDIKLGNEPQIVATEIKKTCRGLGTDEEGLTNIIVRLSVIPNLFRAVLDAHEEMYEKTVEERIVSEVSNSYKEVLLALVAKAREE